MNAFMSSMLYKQTSHTPQFTHISFDSIASCCVHFSCRAIVSCVFCCHIPDAAITMALDYKKKAAIQTRPKLFSLFLLEEKKATVRRWKFVALYDVECAIDYFVHRFHGILFTAYNSTICQILKTINHNRLMLQKLSTQCTLSSLWKQ